MSQVLTSPDLCHKNQADLVARFYPCHGRPLGLIYVSVSVMLDYSLLELAWEADILHLLAKLSKSLNKTERITTE